MNKKLNTNKAVRKKQISAKDFQLAKLNLVIEASNTGIWEMHVETDDPINPDNAIVWSDKFRQMLGYSDESDFPNILASWSEKLHPLDKEKTLNAFISHLLDRSAKTPYDVEYRLLRKNGEYGHFKDYGSTLRDKQGNALWVAGAIKDITKEKNEVERLQMLGDNIPNGVLFQYILNTKTGIFSFEYVSAQWEEVMGFSVEFALNDKENSFAYVHPDDLPIVKQKLEHSIKTLAPFDFEHRNIGDDGKIRWVHMTSHARRENEFVIFDGIAINTTARKEAELKLEQEHERLEMLGGNLPDVALYQLVAENPQKWQFSYVSRTWETIMGVTANNALNNFHEALSKIHPDDVMLLIESIELCGETMTDLNVEVRAIVDDQMRILQFSSRLRRDNESIIADGIVINVTARKESERELMHERNRLQLLIKNMPAARICQFIRDSRTRNIQMSYISSSKWEKITGIPLEVATSDITKVTALIHPDDMPALQQSVEQSARTLSDINTDVRYGDNRWVHINLRPRRDGVFVIWDGFLMDVTNRKETERKLRDDKNRLKMLGDNLPNVVLYQFVSNMQTHKWQFAYVSGTWEAVMGSPAEDVLNDINVALDAVHPEDLPKLMEAVKISSQTKENLNIELRAIIRGENRWLHVVSRKRREGDSIIADGMISDVTNRKEAEQKKLKYYD